MHIEALSASAQNYLKSIFTLQEWTVDPITPSNLADSLELRRSTVSDHVSRLSKQGLVEHEPYRGIELTALGRELALQMVRRHRLIETFLFKKLGYTIDEVHEDAERLEHEASDRFLSRIDAELGHPQFDPHGDPIPASDGSLPESHSFPLLSSAVGDLVVIARIHDGNPDLLRTLTGAGIKPGISFTVSQRSEPLATISLRSASGENPALSFDSAAALRVRSTTDTGADTGVK